MSKFTALAVNASLGLAAIADNARASARFGAQVRDWVAHKAVRLLDRFDSAWYRAVGQAFMKPMSRG